MNDARARGWRRLYFAKERKKSVRKFCSLDVEREVEATIACLSRKELEEFDLDEFREFLATDADLAGSESDFEDTLRRELWWTMVQGLTRGGIPQA